MLNVIINTQYYQCISFIYCIYWCLPILVSGWGPRLCPGVLCLVNRPWPRGRHNTHRYAARGLVRARVSSVCGGGGREIEPCAPVFQPSTDASAAASSGSVSCHLLIKWETQDEETRESASASPPRGRSRAHGTPNNRAATSDRRGRPSSTRSSASSGLLLSPSPRSAPELCLRSFAVSHRRLLVNTDPGGEDSLWRIDAPVSVV